MNESVNKHKNRVYTIIMIGVESAILLFAVALYIILCKDEPYSDAINYFALCGLRVLVLSMYVAFADCLARYILRRRER